MAGKARQYKRYFITSMLLVLVYINIPSAFAALGEVNIHLSGTVVALGCDVDPGDVDKTVNLGDNWRTQEFKNAGDHTRAVGFSIHLTGCTASTVSTVFTGDKDSQDSSLLALNEDSSASGVAIQIMDDKQKRIPVGDVAPAGIVDDKGDVTLNFFANYVATTTTVSPGSADADAEFTLTYD